MDLMQRKIQETVTKLRNEHWERVYSLVKDKYNLKGDKEEELFYSKCTLINQGDKVTLKDPDNNAILTWWDNFKYTEREGKIFVTYGSPPEE